MIHVHAEAAKNTKNAAEDNEQYIICSRQYLPAVFSVISNKACRLLYDLAAWSGRFLRMGSVSQI